MGLREEGYWDKHYEVELQNFEEDGDKGEIWFGKGLSLKIIAWIINHRDQGLKEFSVIDIGCGNGFLLCSLWNKIQERGDKEMKIRLQGIDYSKNSIELSTKISTSLANNHPIEWTQCDFLDAKQVQKISNNCRFNYIIDKGTYDAICLLNSEDIQNINQIYMRSLLSLVDENSIFILASCNNTREELIRLLETPVDNQINWKCEMIGEIETPKIKFGGKEGSQVTCLVIKFNQ